MADNAFLEIQVLCMQMTAKKLLDNLSLLMILHEPPNNVIQENLAITRNGIWYAFFFSFYALKISLW